MMQNINEFKTRTAVMQVLNEFRQPSEVDSVISEVQPSVKHINICPLSVLCE